MKEKTIVFKPDPCIVNLYFSPYQPFRQSKLEKEWKEARNCPRGCGVVCKNNERRYA